MDLQTLRDRYRDDILRLADEHKLEDVRIFGSIARGEANENSDIDLLVHPMKGCSLLDFVGFSNRIEEMVGYKVDLVEDRSVLPRFAPFIFSEAVPL